MRIRKHQIQLDEFEVDSNISPNDKIIGQDSDFPRHNRNYKAKDFAIYVRGGVGNPGDILHNDGGDTWSWREGSGSGVTTTTTIFVPTTTTTTILISTTTTTTLIPTTTTTTIIPTTTTTTIIPTTTTTTLLPTTTTTTIIPTTTTTTLLPTTTTTTIIPTTTTTTIVPTTTTSTTLAPTTTTTTISNGLSQPITASYTAIIPIQGRFSSASNGYVRWPINSFSTPDESKRLMTESTYSYFDTYLDVIFMNNQQTQAVEDLDVGVVLHADNGGNIGPLTQVWSSYFPGGHDYAYIAMDYDGYWDDPNTTTPSDDFLWIKLDKSTSEVLELYSNTNVTTNTLKDISSVNSFASVGSNGSLLFPLDSNGFAILAHATYQDALAQNVTQGVAAYSAFAGEGTYPKLKDQVYTNQSFPYDANVNYGWRAFVVSSSSTSVDYAVKFESSSNVPTANDAIITEIRDANGNSVPEIILPGSATTTTTIAPTTTTTTSSSIYGGSSSSSTWYAPKDYTNSSSAVQSLSDNTQTTTAHADSISTYTNYVGDSVTTPWNLTSYKIDTQTPQVGSFIYDFSGTPIDDRENYYRAGLSDGYPSYNTFTTDRYLILENTVSNIFSGVFKIFNIYRIGDVNGALKIKEVITNTDPTGTTWTTPTTTTTTLAPTTTTTTLAWATPSLLTTGDKLMVKLDSDNVLPSPRYLAHLAFHNAQPNSLARNTWNLGTRTFNVIIANSATTYLTIEACKHIVTYFTGESNPSINTDYDLAVTYCIKEVSSTNCINPYSTISDTTGLKVRYQLDPNNPNPNTGLVRFDDPNGNLSWNETKTTTTPLTIGWGTAYEYDVYIT